MKKYSYLMLVLIIFVLIFQSPVSASQFFIDDQKIEFDITPDQISNDIYLPFDQLQEKFNMELEKLANDRFIIFYNGNFFLVSMEKTLVKTNKGNYNMEKAPLYINNHILLPVEFLREFLNLQIRSRNMIIPDKNEAEEVKANIYIEKNNIDKNEKLNLVIEIMNPQDHDITLKFNTSQRYEILIKNRYGSVVYTWSKKKIFAQVFTEVDIDAKNSVYFEEKIDMFQFQEGTYYIEAIIKGENIELKTDQKRFKVED